MIWWLKASKSELKKVMEISLSGHNRGNEDDPNSCSGGVFGTFSLMHLALSS